MFLYIYTCKTITNQDNEHIYLSAPPKKFPRAPYNPNTCPFLLSSHPQETVDLLSARIL